MATTEDQKEVPESTENVDNPENHEEEEKEEEEPVDLELQKEMKGIKIDDSDFSKKGTKTKKSGKKSKNPEDKKNKKKGQDFLDYANKNNIQINIEYEENKFQLKKKGNKNFGEKDGNKFYDNKKQNNDNSKKDHVYIPKSKRQQPYNFYSGNKFDNFGHRPFQPKANTNPLPKHKLEKNEEILAFLEEMFSEKNLNKDTYIRNRLKDGKILVDDIANYNEIKKNNINAEKILEIIKDSQNLECVNEENKNYIKIKNIDNLKLLTLEQIIESKKAARMKKMQYYPQYQYPYPGYNYISFQNNVFIYPGYNNYPQGSYMPAPENIQTPENK